MMECSLDLTENAIVWMVDGSCVPGTADDLTVVLIVPTMRYGTEYCSRRRLQKCEVNDGEHRITVLVDTEQKTDNEGSSHNHTIFSKPTNAPTIYLIRINGYISSESNGHKSCDPFVCITSYTVIKPLRQDIRPFGTKKPAPSDKIIAGQFSSFFLRHISLFQGGDIISFKFDSDRMNSSDEADDYDDHENGFGDNLLDLSQVQTFSDFLLHQSAMKTTLKSNLASPKSILSSFQNEKYFKAIEKFSISQVNRQNSSLTSNTGRENALRATMISDSYARALQAALNHADDPKFPSLTPDIICSWHKQLGGNGDLIPTAGIYRGKRVKAGTTQFTSHTKIDDELQKVCAGLKVLETNLLGSNFERYNYEDDYRNKRGYGPLIFAAVAMFTIIDIHPFLDGNGRLSRIVANWALRRAGLPFVINIFATTTQRSEYIRSIVYTLQKTKMIPRGRVTDDTFSLLRQKIGIFNSLARLILDRIIKTLAEFEKEYNNMTTESNETDDVLASRKFREKASMDVCLICFDNKPNIATLCCGKAVHLNCMAEWLSSKNTCPQCRTEIPSLPKKLMKAKDENDDFLSAAQVAEILYQGENDMNDSTSESIEDDYDSDSNDDDDDINNNNGQVEMRMDSEISREEERLFRNAISDAANALAESTSNNDQGTMSDESSDMEDTTTDIVDSTDSVDDDADDTTTVVGYNQERSYPRCTSENCSNLAANDCTNLRCGRCCLLFGGWPCPRHGTDN